MCDIIGRKNEIAELKRYYTSGRAEFIAVYGRRRVGKTFYRFYHITPNHGYESKP